MSFDITSWGADTTLKESCPKIIENFRALKEDGIVESPTDVTAHLANTSNPHEVTAAQVNAYTKTASDAKYLPFTGGTLTGALNEALVQSMALASTMAIGAAAGNYIIVTAGTGPITAFDSIVMGARRFLRFSVATTITYNATTMLLPGAANLSVAAGDVLEFVSGGGGIWRCINIQRWNDDITGNAATATTAITATTASTAAEATKLATAKTLGFTGDATGSMSFDGSADANAALTLAGSGVTAGTYHSVTVDEKGRVTAGTNPTQAYTASEITNVPAGNITSTTVQAAINEIDSRVGANILDFRNHLINGNFSIWQRGTSQTTSGYGSADRWSSNNSGTTKTASQQVFTIGQTEVPDSPSYFMRHVVTSVTGASNYCSLIQKIENVTFLSAKTVTLSFYAKADSAKNIAVDLYQNFGTSGSTTINAIGTILIALTTEWKKYTVTIAIPSVSGKTVGINSHTGVRIWLDAGTDFTAQSSSLGQQSGTFDIAQVQLEEGSVATEFSKRPLGIELALCQRYYWIIPSGYITGGAAGYSGNGFSYSYRLPVTMRAVPSISLGTAYLVQCTWTNSTYSTEFILLNINVSATSAFAFTNSTNGFADAEL